MVTPGRIVIVQRYTVCAKDYKAKEKNIYKNWDNVTKTTAVCANCLDTNTYRECKKTSIKLASANR